MSDFDGINIEQYLGLWAMHEPLMLELASHVRTMDLAAHVQAVRAARISGPDPGQIGQYELRDGGVAVIDLVGTMTKYGSSLSQMQYGTVGVRKALRSAVRDDQVKSILLRVDSPGGNYAGTSDLADDVFAARMSKPIVAYIEDLGASAAYFVASQATSVVANATAWVGSIGVYGVIADYSGLAAREGIKVHVVRAGKFKGMGEPGTEVTPEQLAEMQRTVDEANRFFVTAVSRGRPLGGEEVIELADGRVHVAAQAAKLGLIDRVATFDEALELVRNTGVRRDRTTLKQRTKTMTDEQDTATPAAPVAATLSELKAKFPASTAEWREQCLEHGLTLSQCTEQWIKQLEEQNARAAKALAESQAKAAELEKQVEVAKVAGNEPLATGKAGAVDGADIHAQIKALVDEKMAETRKPRHDCQAMVMRENPELREAFVAASNAGKR